MNDLSSSQKKWYVIVAKTIHYKKAAAILEKLGCSFYLPIQKQLHYWSDRKKWVDVPILNPYIFLFTNEMERKRLYNGGDLFQFLKNSGKFATAKEEEIEKIRLLCDHSTKLKMEQLPIKNGDQVKVVCGPLSGMDGFILQENGKQRFLVKFLSLDRFASVEIDSKWLSTF